MTLGIDYLIAAANIALQGILSWQQSTPTWD